jgi:glycosyltransferase involved in cell wall biosynthesis
MRRILFVHNQLTRFVKDDRDLLAERYQVTERFEESLRRVRPVEVARAVLAHDLVFGWFASWHTLLPTLAARWVGRPSIAVVGGYDTARVPEANYGSQRGGVRKLIARTVIRAATRLIVNSEAAGREAVRNAAARPGRISVLYHGVDPIPVGPDDLDGPREPIVLTVGNVWKENLLRKGLLPFVRAAARLPEARFVHVGKWCDGGIDDLRRAAGPNVEFRGFLPDADLFRLYARAAVYVQASLHEGFGMSVAEAMSGGCVPVATRAGSLPEVVGDTGFLTATADPGELAGAVRRALAAGPAARRAARTRVVETFPMARRRAALHALVDRIAAGGSGRNTNPRPPACI